MEESKAFVVPEDVDHLRLDLFLSDQLEGMSRTQCQSLIKDGKVRVNSKTVTKPAFGISSGDVVEVTIPPHDLLVELVPENIPVDIVFEDADVVVVNKPAGLVVHPGIGHPRHTLVNAILYHCKDFIPSGDNTRPGIVHRLDMNTTGLLVVAKNPESYQALREQVERRRFTRRYLALVKGVPEATTGIIEAGIGRSMADPKRMSVTGIKAKEAITSFTVKENYRFISLLELKLSTGRTHQIRVHLRFIGHPILGDPVYGFVEYSALPISDQLRSALSQLPGQALHAQTLGFYHPKTGKYLEFSADPPDYFTDLVLLLREARV